MSQTKTMTYLMTPEGHQALMDEYQHLSKKERPQLVETISWAASNGDRSENGDYIYGKRRLREIDKRLAYLSQRLENAKVVDPKIIHSQTITFGACITLLTEDGEEKCYYLVGEDEIDVAQGKISIESPIGKALMGKKSGDQITVKRPKNDLILDIIKVEYK